jgi:hypothetical protein
MAAVTGTIVALGGLGVSAVQAVKQNKEMKKADAASKQASMSLRSIKEQNAFKQLQVPTLGTELAQQSGAQRDAQAINMLQGAGAEGVIGGVGQLAMAGGNTDLQNAARLDDLKFQRDSMEAEAGQGIESRRSVREFNIGIGEKADAELRRSQAEANKNAAIGNMFGFAGAALESASKIKKKSKAPTAPGTSVGDIHGPMTESQYQQGGAYGQYSDFGLGLGPTL